MYLNRLTIELHYFDKQSRTIEDIKFFNLACSHFEEMIFSFLPKKVNVGGHGFFHIFLTEQTDRSNEFKAFGQILEFGLLTKAFKLEKFRLLNPQDRFFYLLEVLEEAIRHVQEHIELDSESFDQAIVKCRTNGPNRETILKISRTHKSRTIKIQMVRSLEPEAEKLYCRIVNKQGDKLEEIDINPNDELIILGYQFTKSEWKGNDYVVYGKTGKIDFSINVDRYLDL